MWLRKESILRLRENKTPFSGLCTHQKIACQYILLMYKRYQRVSDYMNFITVHPSASLLQNFRLQAQDSLRYAIKYSMI